jgi:hypothetical protein
MCHFCTSLLPLQVGCHLLYHRVSILLFLNFFAVPPCVHTAFLYWAQCVVLIGYALVSFFYSIWTYNSLGFLATLSPCCCQNHGGLTLHFCVLVSPEHTPGTSNEHSWKTLFSFHAHVLFPACAVPWCMMVQLRIALASCVHLQQCIYGVCALILSPSDWVLLCCLHCVSSGVSMFSFVLSGKL